MNASEEAQARASALSRSTRRFTSGASPPIFAISRSLYTLAPTTMRWSRGLRLSFYLLQNMSKIRRLSRHHIQNIQILMKQRRSMPGPSKRTGTTSACSIIADALLHHSRCLPINVESTELSTRLGAEAGKYHSLPRARLTTATRSAGSSAHIETSTEAISQGRLNAHMKMAASES